MTAQPEAPTLRDCVDAIWDMRAEMWSGEGYDQVDTIVTDAYAAGAAAERARSAGPGLACACPCHEAAS